MNHFNCIYIYINKINNHKYVGQAKDFNKRYKQHINSSNNKKQKYDYNVPFHNAIRKYGIENFEIIILKENLKTKCLMDLYEYYYIKKYDCLSEDNYNISDGGHNGNPFAGKSNEEMKEIGKRISEKNSGINNGMYGKHHKEESKQKIKEKQIWQQGENHPMYGKHHNEKTKQKMSESLKGRESWNKGKKISEEHKQKIKESKKNISKETREKISKSREQYKGKNHPRARKVAQYDLDGNLIKVWDYIKQVADYLGVSKETFRTRLNGKYSNEYKGFIWKYLEEEK